MVALIITINIYIALFFEVTQNAAVTLHVGPGIVAILSKGLIYLITIHHTLEVQKITSRKIEEMFPR